MEAISTRSIFARLPQAKERPSSDHPAFSIPAGDLVSSMLILRDEFNFDILTDVTAIDWGVDAQPRFTGIYHLYSLKSHTTIRVACDCDDVAKPSLPSITSVWPAADWHEREAYDMFGIHYEGHPDLRRILMWDSFPHHPLRKDFPLAGVETELPAADVGAVTGTQVEPAPMMGGPFHAPQGTSMAGREPSAADQSWTEGKPKPKQNQ